MNARWAASVSLSIVLHVTFLCLTAFFWSAAPSVFVSPQNRNLTVTLRAFPASAPKGADSVAPPSQALSAPEAAPKKTVQRTSVPKKTATKPAKPKSPKPSVAPVEPRPVASLPEASLPARTQGVASSGAQGTQGDVAGGAAGVKVVDVSSLSVSRRVRPDYPAIARKRKEEGTVVLIITLDGTNIVRVDVEKSSGFSSLDSAAVVAVKKWRFDNSGKIQARVPVTFRLTS